MPKNKSNNLRIALAQMNPIVGDLTGNQKKIVDYIQRAKAEDADIIAFPELIVCGYPPEDLLFKDHFVRDNIKVMYSLCKVTKGITAIVGFAEMDAQRKLYNAAAVASNGKLIGVYHKQELPNYGVFDEKRYFHAGDKNKIFSLGQKHFGVSICEDIWIEKGVCQSQASMGAQVLINISGSPYDVGKLKQREQLLKQRAKQNKTFIGYVNLVGGQDELIFDGGSLVIGPDGKTIAAAKQFEEDLLLADLPIADKKGKKPNSANAISVNTNSVKENKKVIKRQMAKRYSEDERTYHALVLGTRDYTKKNGFQKTVLGLSGGIDSALVAAIAVDALGENNVIGVTMPSQFTSEGTKSDAHKLAENLGIQLMEIPIEKIFKTYLTELKGPLKETKFGLAEENLQARIRGDILMTLSNKFGMLVLTTGNKSEVGVGYCTLYGDMSGGFAVIKDVPKTKVYDLAKLRNGWGKNVIPVSIIKRAPSAELRSNQRDQDSLPPYDTLDDMLKEYVEQHWSLAKMARKNTKDLIKNVVTMVDRSEYKRRQAPPGIKITQRAFGKDWRLPITNRYKEF